MHKIAIIDYSMGNLLSVKRACEYWGYDVVITDQRKEIKKASHVILPGVGAFPEAMKQLHYRGLDEIIFEDVVLTEKPLLGICLGMQLLMDRSEEFGSCDGLKIIPGEVKKISDKIIEQGYKLPYIGWNCLSFLKKKKLSPLFYGLNLEKDSFYFVHSYKVSTQSIYREADTYYAEEQISAVIHKENVFGCQFHPEKSGKAGLQLLKNFLLYKG